MKRSNVNFLVDAVAFAMFVFLVATGVLMEFLLPAGSGHSMTLWGMDRHQWGSLHFWISVTFLTAMAVHVYLHWRWIVSVLRGRPREGSGLRVGLGLLGLGALLAIAIAPLVSPVERFGNRTDEAAPRWSLSDDSEAIMGAMTLGEVAANTGVPIHLLVAELALPNNVSADDRLGRLARDAGISVADVRAVVEQVSETDNARVESNGALADTPPELPDSADGSPRVASEDHAEDHASGEAGLSDIRGSLTLSDIVLLGVPRDILFQELGIPGGTPMSERLGRLGRAYGFSMTQVRDLVDAYR